MMNVFSQIEFKENWEKLSEVSKENILECEICSFWAKEELKQTQS